MLWGHWTVVYILNRIANPFKLFSFYLIDIYIFTIISSKMQPSNDSTFDYKLVLTLVWFHFHGTTHPHQQCFIQKCPPLKNCIVCLYLFFWLSLSSSGCKVYDTLTFATHSSLSLSMCMYSRRCIFLFLLLENE